MNKILLTFSFFSLLVGELLVYLFKYSERFGLTLNHQYISTFIFIEKIFLFGFLVFWILKVLRSKKLLNRDLLKSVLGPIFILLVGLKCFDLQKFYLEKKLEENVFQKNIDRIEVGYRYTFLPDQYFNKTDIIKKTNGRFSELVRFLKEDFAAQQVRLSRDLAFEGNALKSVYLMSYVSTVWPYGNKIDTKSAGCVFNNEQDRSKSYGEKTFKDFLSNSAGCCTNYAHLLKALLDAFEISNSTIQIGGHIFNEVSLGEKESFPKLVLDANTNFVYLSSWEEIQNSVNKFRIIVLPHPSSNIDSDYFRPLATNFQQIMLAAVERGGIEYKSENTLPEFFKILISK